MKNVVFVLVILGLAQAVSAQTPMASWTQPDAATAAEAQTLIPTLYVNGGPIITILTGVACTGTAPNVTCSAPVPANVPLTLGTRYELTVKTATSEESPRSIPFIRPPGAPTNLRVQ